MAETLKQEVLSQLKARLQEVVEEAESDEDKAAALVDELGEKVEQIRRRLVY